MDALSGIEGFARMAEQGRLVVEEVHLAGPAVHEQLDHPLRPRRVVRQQRASDSRRRPRQETVRPQQLGQSHPTKPRTEPVEELTAGGRRT